MEIKIRCVPVGHDTWQLFMPRSATEQQLEKGIQAILELPGAPNNFLIAGERYSYADLSNAGARKLLFNKI